MDKEEFENRVKEYLREHLTLSVQCPSAIYEGYPAQLGISICLDGEQICFAFQKFSIFEQ